MRIRDFHAATADVMNPGTHMRQPASSIRSLLPLSVGMILLQTACFSSAAQQVTGGIATAPSPSAANHASIASNYGKLPLSFEANQGQVDPRVRFLSRGNGYSLFLTDKEAVLSLRKAEKGGPAAPMGSLAAKSQAKKTPSFESDVVRMQLAGASSRLAVTGADELPGMANYSIGNDPSKWHSNVPTFGKVRYEGVYPGVDLVYYGNQQQLEYDFVIKPGADAKSIRVRFAGAKKLRLDENGDLEVIAKNGKIAFRKPVVYQEMAGERHSIEGHFTLLAGGEAGFAVADYDRARPLVIDPTLSYSTYLGGGNGATYGTAIAVDGSGDAYVTGVVYATDFPASSGSYQMANKKSASTFDAFVAKLNPTGTALAYATYLGGSGNTSVAGTLNHGDYPTGISVDGSGEAYVCGIAYSVDFPVSSGAFQMTNKGGSNGVSNGFVTKLNATGTSLVYSTYLGGSGITGYAGNASLGDTGGDGCASVAIDASGDAFLTGTAYSTDFPLAGSSYQTMNHASGSRHPNAFAAKLNSQGTALDYSTYLGGSTGDGGSGIAVDSSGNAYIDGATYSTDFPISGNALQGSNKAVASVGSNAFVAKLNVTGSSLLYSTYLGGSGNPNGPSGNNNGDVALSIALDSAENAYLFGLTSSSDFPVTSNVLQPMNNAFAAGEPDYFIAKVNPSGSGLVYATYLGGSQASLNAGSSGLAVDSSGDAYVTGYVIGTDYPVSSNPYQSAPACALEAGGPVTEYTSPVFSELNPDGTALLYSTYFGGSGGPVNTFGAISERPCDFGYGVALDSQGNAYLTGSAVSSDFPNTPGAYQRTNPANGSAFVSKFLLSSNTTTIATKTVLTSSADPAAVGASVTLTATVSPAGGNGIPTGTVTFSVDGGAGTAVALNGSGQASYSTTTLTAGTHMIGASYSGDTNYTASATSLSERIIGPAASIAVVSGSGQSAVVGSAFAAPLIVIVEDANGNPVSGANVSFTGTGLSFGSAATTTGADGMASTTATPTTSGSVTATAATTGVSASAIFTLTGATTTAPSGSGIITTYAGDGSSGFSGDGGVATAAELNVPVGLAIDSDGNIYVSDQSNNRVRKITPTGIILTVAGNGTAGFSGDGGAATSAELNAPAGLAIDSGGNLYIGDENNHRIRKVTAGIISTFAGTGTGGYNGDGIAATSAELNYPNGVTADLGGNIYIADYFNNRIRVVNSSGIISTVAGNGTAGFSGDGGPATSAEFNLPTDVTLDQSGNLYIADNNNARVREVNTAGVINTIAGTGYGGYNGDGIPATSAELYAPDRVATDSAGNVYISEFGNNRVRKIDTTGIISTVAGTGTPGYSGDGGPATRAEINIPRGVVIEGNGGSIFISDSKNNRVRQVQYQVADPAFSVAGGAYTSSQTVTITDTTPGATIYYTTNGTTPTTSSMKFAGSITVSSSETIEAIASATGYSNSAVASAVYTINVPAAATPTFSPAAGTYTSVQSVAISDTTTGAAIYYTTDGTTPTSSSTAYAGPIAVSSTETIQAIAVAAGYSNSAVASALYTIKLPPPVAGTPTFSPAAGTYTSVQNVTISDTTTGAAIYYTTDGTTPTSSSTAYAEPIAVNSTETIEAIAVATGYSNSAVATAAYTINLPPATFTLSASPATASINSGQTATFTLSVTPQNGFNQTVSFSCSDLPSGDACSFSPSTVTPAGAAVSSTMTIAPSSAAMDLGLPLWEKASAGIALALLLWPFGRRRPGQRLALLILLVVGAIIAGCGGGSKSQNYTVSVAASGGGVSQTSSISLTVTP